MCIGRASLVLPRVPSYLVYLLYGPAARRTPTSTTDYSVQSKYARTVFYKGANHKLQA